jgi:hypothetical protein
VGWDFDKKAYPNFDPKKSTIGYGQLRKEPFFELFTKLRILNGGADPNTVEGIDLSSPEGAKHAGEYSICACQTRANWRQTN